MDWIKKLSYEKKRWILIGSLAFAILTGGFLVGRISVSPSDLGDDITAEIRQSIGNIEQATADQSAAMGILGEQYVRLGESLDGVGRIEEGILRLESYSRTIETIVGGLLDGEQVNRDLIIESAILVDRNERLIRDLREEASGGEGSSD